MKKNIVFLVVVSIAHLLVLLMCLVGCSEDVILEGDGNIPEGDGTAIVNVKLDAASVLGTDDMESKIHKVRVLAFRSTDGALKMNEYREFPFGYDVNNDIIKGEIKTGLTDVLLIANETPAMTASLNQLGENITTESVRTQVLSVGEVAYLNIADSIASKGIPMYKECSNLGIKISNTENNPYKLDVELERILAKVTLTIQNQTHQEITLDSVVAKVLPLNSWLFPTAYTGDTLSLNAFKLIYDAVAKTYQPLSLYLPEYLLTDITKRSYLEIKGTAIRAGLSPIPCSYKISLGNGLKGYGKEGDIEAALDNKVLKANDFHIIRNTHYEINVSDIKGYNNDQITFFVGVAPWYNATEDYYEGGTWLIQPVSQRIAFTESTKFDAQFIHSEAPLIVYEWHRRRYLQTEAEKEPTEPVDEIVYKETLPNGTISIYNIPSTSDPTASGEIYCKASPIGSAHFRESVRATLMVIGDWEGGGDAFPYMQNWIPKENMPLGASYLLRDIRDNKVYRAKLMADGNWWMIQDLAYKNPNKELTPIDEFRNTAILSSLFLGQGALDDNFYGTCCSSNEKTGGYLYTPEAAIADYTGLINAPNATNQEENILSVCPSGWHLPGNKDLEWNKEWSTLTDYIAPVDVTSFSMFDYFNDKHFNAYTTTWVGMQDHGNEVEFKRENTFRFHGGYFTAKGMYTSLGIKVGFDSLIIPQQTDILYIFTNPFGSEKEDYVFPFPQFAGPIRCIRDYKYN